MSKVSPLQRDAAPSRLQPVSGFRCARHMADTAPPQRGFGGFDMLSWLKSQVRVVEHWREELARQPDIDLDAVIRVETHYQWLTEEVARLEG
ncbi:MAG: hypothetical protein AAGJ84_10150 [Pseudomonadota bacterium]